MPYIEDDIFDNGLSQLANQTNKRIDINYTQEPTTYTEATNTYSCGNKIGLTMSAISNGATDGRRVQTPAITDGSVTATETAGWWSLTDNSSTLHAAGALDSTEAVSSSNTFQLGAISITLRDAA